MVCVVGRGGIVPYLTLPLPRRMSSSRASRSTARAAAAINGLRFQDIAPLPDLTNPPSPPKSTPASRNRIPKCVKGARYKVPGGEFDEDSEDSEAHPEWFYGVVTNVLKTCCTMLFQGDDLATRYDAHLETWNEYRVAEDAELDDFDEQVFQAIEIKAKLRKAPKPASRRKPEASKQTEESDDSDEEDAGDEEDGPQPVETWESDLEDDECELEPELHQEEIIENDTLEAQVGRASWTDVGNLQTDPRASAGAMPENISPSFLMPAFRDESLLNWFLFYMPLSVISDIVKATNDTARKISWPAQAEPWKPLRPGEFLKWVGVWILMTVYPSVGGGRRTYWRGIMKFQRYMSEKRFENILRAFTLPQYKKEDPEWGGEGREFYREQKYDKFQEVRKFTDTMRKQFQNALKPGGWLCIDESMFAWLGRALKMPGWKIIKRKPHPIGLEAKTTACAVVGVLIDFEFQEGTKPMGQFEFIECTNRSSAWLLRLTKHWHNSEPRTVIADAAFAQVRAAVALKRIGGLYLIGNVKGCHKFFCQAALRAECGEYERDKLVVLTKKMTVGTGTDAVTVYGTGWRCTGAMVVTYVHTGGTNAVGTDRTKRKYTQMTDGSITTFSYSVKRPKVSSEYQHRMGAIDGHNYRRQSGKGVGALEKVCITRNTKDRIFISIVSWILINVFLIKKFFVWGGEEKKTAAEFQESVAMALIHNQLLGEDERNPDDVSTDEDDMQTLNDPALCLKHPDYKKNTCRHCYKHTTVYYCDTCSDPQGRKKRADKGPNGGTKWGKAGYMHFCKHGGCYANHDCGNVPRRRTKDQMTSSAK